MKITVKALSLIAVFLLVFIVAVGITIWLLDFVSQQRVFGLLVSAEFLAFALLVYLYYAETPKDLSRKWLFSGFAALAALVLLAAAIVAGVGLAPTSTMEITLYAGEISTTLYGFGTTSSILTSPGPTLNFKVGDVVNLTLVNVGQMAHNWALVNANQSEAPVLFNAEIGDTVPLLTNRTESVVFTVTKAGSFFYICEVDAHLQLGMWGRVIVNP